MPKKRLDERIDAALAGGPMSFYDLASVLYPDNKSWRYQQNGGPPGCYMAPSAGIRRHNFHTSRRNGLPGPGNLIVYPPAQLTTGAKQ